MLRVTDQCLRIRTEKSSGDTESKLARADGSLHWELSLMGMASP